MNLLRSQPSLHLLQYASEGYSLSEEEVSALESCGWVRSIPRETIPLLRRSRGIAWEIQRLEEIRRSRIPSNHRLVRQMERLPPIRRRRERELNQLNREIARLESERDQLAPRLSPFLTMERDRLRAYRPVSSHRCIRLTDEGKRILLSHRFSRECLTIALSNGGVEMRVALLREIHSRLMTAGWWNQRGIGGSDALRKDLDRDSFWLAAVLSGKGTAPEEAVQRSGELFARFSRNHLWRQDPLPLCMILLSSRSDRTVDDVIRANNLLVKQGFGVGVEVLAAAVELVAGTPRDEAVERSRELHHLWKTMVGYGLAFSQGLLPSATRLATVRRPVEASAVLLREFDNKTTRFHRMNDRATRIAALMLASLPLDYRDRPDQIDLFQREDNFTRRMIERYRVLQSAMAPRCAHTDSGLTCATVYAGLLATHPGSPDTIIDRLDDTRRRLSDAGPSRGVDEVGVAVLLMDSCYREEWGVRSVRWIWDLYHTGYPLPE